MKKLIGAAVVLPALFLAGSALAGERTVTLDVQNVTCETCGPIVKRTLARAPGVKDVKFIERAGAATATVTFDDAKVTPEALATAVTNAGYPAKVKQNGAS